MSKALLEAFTDAVIAIVMTILVLNLAAPVLADFTALWEMRYSFLIYLISFFSLAVYWNNHHHLFQIAQKINGRILWLNMVFLLCLSLYPFATSWVEKNLTQRVPELTFGANTLLGNASYALLARQLVKVNGPHSRIAKALQGSKKSVFTLGMNLAGIAIGLFFPPAVIVLFVLSMVPWVVPERRIEHYLNETDNQ